MPPVMRMPKSPIKASVARHDEPCKDKDHRADLDPDCAICQLPVGKKSPEGVKEGYSVLPCGHVFGSVCIKTYLAITEKPQCPICRANMYHACSHPVYPALYNPKNARLSPAETAAKAFFVEYVLVNCKYCRKRQLARIKKSRRREIMNAARSASGSSSASSSSDGTTSSGSTTGEGGGGVGKKATRKIKTPPLGDLDSEEDGSGSGSGSTGDDDTDQEDDDHDTDEDDIDGVDDEDPGSPASPSQSASRHGLPPVPGPYGRWDLANKERDWKFVEWYNRQEPRIVIPREHYS